MAVKNKKVLDIYIDEGGDFGISKDCSLLYVVSMVMFDNSNNIEKELKYLEEKLNKIGFKGMIHTAPLVENRSYYSKINTDSKKNILKSLINFSQKININIKSLIINKEYINSQKQLIDKLEIEMFDFILCNFKYLNSFDEIIIYYDKGQELLTKIIKKVFKNLNNFKIITKFEYNRLFQISDMLTLIDKIAYKVNNKLYLIKSEKLFLKDFDLNNILKKLFNKRL